MSGKRVLSVGQCAADHGALTARLRQLFEAEVIPADSEQEALGRLEQEAFALVLVNRVFDANGASGIDFLKRVKEKSEVPVMLVSNYEDAQRDAVAAGALPGFGKAALRQFSTEQCLRPVLGT
jgi:CheY-like chemotaxis protein